LRAAAGLKKTHPAQWVGLYVFCLWGGLLKIFCKSPWTAFHGTWGCGVKEDPPSAVGGLGRLMWVGWKIDVGGLGRFSVCGAGLEDFLKSPWTAFHGSLCLWVGF